MGALGLMGVLVPEEYGGAGFGYLEYITAISEISKNRWVNWTFDGGSQFFMHQSHSSIWK